MKNIATLLLMLSAIVCRAHPGIGIVKDSKGNIYYSDLTHVWKIPAAGGGRHIAVRNVHTHELYMDVNDNLYGEHLWYNGEQANTWGHYLWRLGADGKLARLQDTTLGFREGYSFVRDAQGNMYWAERWTTSRFRKKTPAGQITTIAQGKFREVRWMHSTKAGVIYFLDLDKLYAIRNGAIALLAEGLNESTAAFEFVGERHNAYGIWTDEQDNVYIALHGGQRVKKITPGGAVSTFLQSASPWSPTAGVFDKDGNLWLQEYTLTNECRVRKIHRSELAGGRHANAFLMNDMLPFGIAGVLLIGMTMSATGIRHKWQLLRSARA